VEIVEPEPVVEELAIFANSKSKICTTDTDCNS